MFSLRKKGPSKTFTHADGCKILAADPDVQIQWSEIRRGVWEAICLCGRDYWYDPVVDDRVRLDPLDPKTARHLGQCEFVGETDGAMLRVLLKVTDKGDYDWGRMQLLRRRLAGSALRRKRRVTTSSLPRCGAGRRNRQAAGWTARARGHGPASVHGPRGA